MSEEMKTSFDLLNIDLKRKQINKELLIIDEMIKTIEQKCGLSSNLSVNNYISDKNDQMDEDESLSIIYNNIFNVEKKLLSIIDGLSKDRSE